MEAEVGEPGAENSEVTGNSEEMTGVVVVQGDQSTLLLPEVALPVRREVRVQSMKKYPNDAASVVLKQAVRRMRVTWPPLTRRPPHPRRERLLRSPLPPTIRSFPIASPSPILYCPGWACLHSKRSAITSRPRWGAASSSCLLRLEPSSQVHGSKEASNRSFAPK